MDKFLLLPRYPYKAAIIDLAPEESGIYGLFDGFELIYIGVANRDMGQSIRACLLRHQHGTLGNCTINATSYSWEISYQPKERQTEVLEHHVQANGSDPRCQQKIA